MKITLITTVACILLALSTDPMANSFEVIQKQGTGHSKALLQERVTLKLSAAEFDPLTERLQLKNQPMDANSMSKYGLVQVNAKDTESRKKITALGAKIITYMPDDAYVIEWANSSQEKLFQSGEFRFVGPYESIYKLSPGLWQHLEVAQKQANKPLKIELVGFTGTTASSLEKLVRKYDKHATIEHRSLVNDAPHLMVRLSSTDKTTVLNLIQAQDVMWVDRFLPNQAHNIDSVGPIQSNGTLLSDATLWNRGITGTGQVVAVADSGLDRNMDFFSQYNTGDNSVIREFTDAELTQPGQVGQLFPERKLVGYFVQQGASAYDDDETCSEEGGSTDFHGTHVTGSVAGDGGTPANASSANYDNGDGMAPHAQILFQDIGSAESGCLSGIGGYSMFQQAAKSGASISSNSYGADALPVLEDVYRSNDQQADAAAYDIEDILLVFSAGNDGSDGIGHPGQAKNVLTVGALGHGDSTATASFSSRGPTYDGRNKPDIVAPGVGIISAAGDTDNAVPVAQPSAATKALSGTSMATPTVSGGAALMRQYFTEGYYPTGNQRAADEIKPSGSLLKSTLLNGTLLLPGTPSTGTGWGRIFLDNNLYFAGDDRTLRVWDLPNSNGLRSGEEMSFKVRVPLGDPFRATLSWFDPPAALGNGLALVNDLDLEVKFNGQVYKGNNFFNNDSLSGGRSDTKNNVEQVSFQTPIAGEYEITVKGTQVNGINDADTLKQGFALVTSQGVCQSTASPPPAISVSLSPQGDPVVDLGSISGDNDYQIYRQLDGCGNSQTGFRYVGQLSGQSVLTSLLDEGTVGGQQYGYAVRTVDACGESQLSTCQAIQSNAACNLEPQFNTTAITASAMANDFCSVTLQWPSATSNCSGAGIVYNIYRSETKPFAISDSTRVASAVRDLSYVDFDVDSGKLYHYLVTAVDGNGNESLNNNILTVLTQGDEFEAGDFVEDPDTQMLAVLDSPWQINDQFAATGNLSYHNTGPGLPYPPDTCAYVTLPALELQSGATLSYDARFNLELGWDGVVVEVSTNGGASWQDLPPAGGYPSSFNMTEPTPGVPVNACGYPRTQGAFNGSQNSFENYTSDLSAFAGEQVMVRWAFSSDPGSEEDGFYLDNIMIDNASSAGQCSVKAITKNTAGPWFNPNQDGHGLFLEISQGVNQTDDRITAYWYAYLNDEPVWLLGTGPTDGNSANLDMLITEGGVSPPNFDSNDVAVSPWGTLGLDFDLQNNVTVSWDSLIDDFGAGSMDMTQLTFISDSPKACLSGSYSDPAQPGHGYVVEILGGTGSESVLITWYSYDNDGNQIWLIGSAPLVGDTASVPVSLFEGGEFPPDFVAANLSSEVWGTLELDFSRLNALDVSWDAVLPGYSDGQVAAAKLTELKGRGCN